MDKPSTNHRHRRAGSPVIWRQLRLRLQENSLFDIVNAIRQAKDDRNITGIVLDLKKHRQIGRRNALYPGKALREFRDSGKRFAVGYSPVSITSPSFASEIWLSPQGR